MEGALTVLSQRIGKSTVFPPWARLPTLSLPHIPLLCRAA